MKPRARKTEFETAERARRVAVYREAVEAGRELFTGEAYPAPARTSWVIACGHCGFATPCVRGESPPLWRTFVLGCGAFFHECASCAGLWDECHGGPGLAFGVVQPGRALTPDEAIRAKTRRKGAA
ncbi:MAG: hypothetical protein KF873_02145 [Gemmataceae bacterium]|nr:hypothetical protein [Gemmataceae bacterium]